VASQPEDGQSQLLTRNFRRRIVVPMTAYLDESGSSPGRCPMLGWIKYLRKVRVETDALKRNKDLASTRTPLSLVRDEGVAGFKAPS
jgi:hypothetical protein